MSPPSHIPQQDKEERIAKVMARAGVCSRRDAEQLILAGRVSVNNMPVTTPAIKVKVTDRITVDHKLISPPDTTRVWLYHKPRGLLTTHRDEKGRETVFDHLPDHLPRLISVGRLDQNSEGLLLLTNNGELARWLEHPTSQLKRIYHVRVYGTLPSTFNPLKKGITLEGIHYKGLTVKKLPTDIREGKNIWLEITLYEGKNREIRKIMEYYDLKISRLKRIHYGEFSLGTLKVGAVSEVSSHIVNQLMAKARPCVL